MRARAGRIKYNVDISKFRHVHQPDHPFMGGGDAHTSGTRQTVGLRINADHHRHLQMLTVTQNFNHQIGANVARTDNGDFTLTHDRLPFGAALENVAATEPMPSIWASKRSPAFTATIGPNAPVRMISPARSGSPRLAILRASQTAALSGCPRHSLPRPLETSSLLRVIFMAQFSRSTPAGRCAGPPMTYTPQEALSATVSTN